MLRGGYCQSVQRPAVRFYQRALGMSWKSAKHFCEGGFRIFIMAHAKTKPTTVFQSFADHWISRTCTYAVGLSLPAEAVPPAWRPMPGAVTAAEWCIHSQNSERPP